MSLPIKYNKADKKLIKAFIQAQKEIDSLLFSALQKGNIKEAKILSNKAKAINEELKKIYKYWSKQRNLEEYLHWLQNIEKDHFWKIITKTATIPGKLAGLETIHIQAVREMLWWMNGAVIATLDGVNKNITYSLAIFAENTIRSTLAKNIILGNSLHEQKKGIVKLLTSPKWFGTLKDRSWRVWNPQTYAEMLVRTETARAYNQGKMNKAIELWYTKFEVVEDVGCCSVCAGHNGKIIDITNKTSVELPPYHPNCRGTIKAIRDNINPKASRFGYGIDKKVNKLAEQYNITGKNTLEKIKQLNKKVPKGRGNKKTDIHREIYTLKDEIIIQEAKKKGFIADKRRNTVIPIKQDGVRVKWHIEGNSYHKLKKLWIIKKQE